MYKGFIFNHDLCVNCSACSAACKLVNGFTVLTRRILTFNSCAYNLLPVINLSLACNHCLDPKCLKGCPASAIKKAHSSDAVIIDEERCIGCRYCQWNCPYGAPIFDAVEKIIKKCHFCYSAINEGLLPVCTTACPTGALKFGTLSNTASDRFPQWFPGKNFKPLINLTGALNISAVRIIPDDKFAPHTKHSEDNGNRKSMDWSLFAFSFLTTVSVALIITSFVRGVFPDLILVFSLNSLAVIISLLHPGRTIRAWRAITNPIRSPLSREIIFFLLYLILSFSSAVIQIPALLISASVTGLLLLAAIDYVYIYSDNRISLIFHSGQTFLSGLLLVSFFSGSVPGFIFIAALKLISSVYYLIVKRTDSIQLGLRFVRVSFLLITGVCLLSKISYHDPVVSLIFIIGEVLDRMIFYIDFLPVSIEREIFKHIKIIRNEKKRG